MNAARLVAVTVVLACGASGELAFADTAAAPAKRPFVALRLDRAEIGEDHSNVLVALVRADLAELGIGLLPEPAPSPGADWFSAHPPEGTLLLASVEVGADDGWTVVLVDPREERILVRELPSASRDAAALEAVASIVVSAAATLAGEGPSPGASADAASEPSAARVEFESKPTTADVLPIPAREADSTSLQAVAFASFASFDSRALATFGPALAIGAANSEGFLELEATRHFGRTFRSSYGAFDLVHWAVRAHVGPALRVADWTFAPVVGAGVDVVERSGVDPAESVTATDEQTSLRFAAHAGLRLRYPVGHSFAFDGAVLGSFVPEPLVFTATDRDVEVAAPWQLGVWAALGASVGF